MKKSILSIILIFLMLGNTVFASSLMNESFTDMLSEEWIVSTTGGGEPSAAVDGGELRLRFGATDTASNKRAMITSPVMTVDTKCFVISFKSTITGSDSSLARTFTLLDSANKSKTLLAFTGTELKFFDDTVYKTALTEGQEYSFIIYLDENADNAYIWIDGECVLTQKLTDISWPTLTSERQLRFENRGTRAVEESVWMIDDLKADIENTDTVMSVAPENGSKMVRLDNLANGIELDYGKVMAPSAYDYDNYVLYVNEMETDFTISQDGYKVYITPYSGFAYDTDYRLVVNEIKTLDNVIWQENYEISFDSEVENYAFPVITTDKDEYTCYLGETVAIVVDVETEAIIESIKFSINGEVIEEFTNPESKTVTLEKTFEAGEYDITISVTDDKGGTAQSKTVKVIVLQNNPPSAEIMYPNSAKLLSKAGTDVITVNAEDSDSGIDKVELYVDGELYAEDMEAPYEFAPSEMSPGVHNIRAVVYDIYGMSAQATGTITVVINRISKVMADNITFDTYTGDNNTYPSSLGFSGTLNNNQNAFIKGGYANEYEENGGEHGRSIIFGGLEEGKSGGAWMSFPTGTIQGTADIEFDFYIHEKADYFGLYLRAGTGGDSSDVRFNKSGIVLGNRGGSSVTIPYEEKTWYRVKYIFDIAAKTYSFYLYNEQTQEFDCYAKEFSMSSSTISTLASCRLTMPSDYEGYNFIAIDNVTSVVTSNYPYISDVTYGKDDIGGDVDISTDRINIKLSGSIDSASLTADKVKIYSTDDTAEISSITYESATITAKLARPLISNESYTIELARNIKLSEGENIGEILTARFKTVPQKFDIYNGSFTKSGSHIKFTASLRNSLGSDVTAWVIMTVFDGQKIKSTTVKKYTCSDETGAELTAPYIDGNTVQVTVWDGLVKPRFISNKIYKF